ncbi:MAG TPA: TolC family protein [Pirellulales bacterium]|nr:TolC family protein [Pirellulales bacterium]
MKAAPLLPPIAATQPTTEFVPLPPLADRPELPNPASILNPETAPIDLDSALRLAGVRNPELMQARARVSESIALRQFAAAQILPSINLGTNYDNHQGNLQASDGSILNVDRQAVYVGAGTNAVGAGTVQIPGVQYNLNLSDSLFGFLRTRQVVAQRTFANVAARNDVLLRVSVAHVDLMRGEGSRAVAVRTRDESAEVARLTESYARAGVGRLADADRAATELARRQTDVLLAEASVLTVSARLAALLNLDPVVRLHPIEPWIVPVSVVPDTMPLSELVAISLLQRPELAERRAAIREALLAADAARVLPFSPQIILGYSAGGFGGGILGTPTAFDGRSDFDAIFYWTLQNLGVGNAALVRAAEARARIADFQQLVVLNRVRQEVAEAYARIHARQAQIVISEQAVLRGQNAFAQDMKRIRGQEGLPIEVLDSLRLLGRAREDYLNAIADFNRAQLEMYVALGQPPADVLAQPQQAIIRLPPVPSPLPPVEEPAGVAP